MKTTIQDEKVSGKISEDDRKKIMEACDSALKWLDANQMAEKDEFEHRLKDIENICSPIITRLYQSQGGAPGAGGMPGGASAGGASAGGPTIEEVD
jgi:heat shock protein 1/8